MLKPYTFAIRTSQCCNQKLQKSMSCQRTDRQTENKAHGHNNVYKSLGSNWLN
jgi:hypothetical protein